MLRIDPGLTEDQQKAVAARGASVSVSAAAGSGKTKVLVERLIGILTDEEHPSPADQLVVVTFTKDAAAEVRSRLSIALSKQLLEDPENAWLRAQQTHLKSAHISTIHRFCFDLLREQFAALDISAGFRVMDDTEEAELRRKTAEEVLEETVQAAESDPDAAARLALLTDAFCGSDDTPLIELIEALYEIVSTVPFGEEMLPRFAAKAASGKMLADAMQEFCGQITECESVYAQAQTLYDSIIAEQRTEHEEKAAKSRRARKAYAPPKSYDTLCEEHRGILRVKEAAETGDPARVCKALDALAFGRFAHSGDPRIVQCGAMRAFAKDLAADLKKQWRIPLEYALPDCERHAKLLSALAFPLHDFSERLDAHKRERSALGFGDAMRCTLHLLAERAPDGTVRKTALAETLSEQFSYIMIDEFQDADSQQDLIFRMLSRGGDALHYGNNLFFVGDSKQCIYRFRNANPRIFYEALQSGAPFREAMLTENTRIDLNRNFRSSQEVVDFVNCIFSGLMTERVGEVDYDERQALVRGASYPEGDRPVELLLFEETDDPQTEPDLVAARIRRHLDLGTPVKDRDTGVQRPCKPGDFMILLRKKSRLEDFAAALKRAGIPVCSVAQQSYLNAPEILLLLAILRAADNPLLDVPVAAAMLSPMMGFTLDEVTQIRLAGEQRGLYRSMLFLTQTPESAFPELTAKCTHFLQFLESMRLCAAMETPEQLIRRIYLCTDFLGLMQMTQGGEQKKANLRALVTYAHTFEENRGGGLSAFLRYIDAMLSRSQDLAGGGIPAVSEDVVQLKTIHGSKGLEAPFVILADASTGFSTADRRARYQFHADKGLAFRLQDPETLTRGCSLPYVAISAQNQRESVSEELRLLYVALTRARERLILPVSLKGVPNKAKKWAAIQTAGGAAGRLLAGSAGSHADWLLMPLIRHQAGEMLRRTLDLEVEKDPGLPQIRMTTEVIAPADAPAETASDAAPAQDVPAAAAVDRHLLEAQCAWTYESAGAHLTAKYGVSELAKSDDISAPLRRPLFVRENHGKLSGAERGTALHTFLQYANFAAAAQDLSAEIAHVRQRGRLSEKQAEAVRASNIAAFFRSELYARAAAAKRIWREKKFIVRLSDLHLSGPLAQLGADYAGTEGMLTGIMDLVFEEEDGLVLADYKTDRVQSGAQLLEQYTEQIRLYAEALRLITGKPVKECVLYSLHLNQTVPVVI